jgi:hypothetical protein
MGFDFLSTERVVAPRIGNQNRRDHGGDRTLAR